jgi:hypothetical protein
VQANQLGRVAMTRIVDELHSSCLASNFAPIQANSSGTELIFKNAYSSEAVIPNAKEAKTAGTGVFEHQIVWNKTAGTITDFTYKSTSGEGAEAVFPKLETRNAEPVKGVLLASNITESENSAKVKVPVFQYYEYAKESESSATTPLGTLTGLSSPLTAASAAEAASVLISFRQIPSDKKIEHDQFADFSNQATLALSAPNSETPIQDSPCE